jgi:valyl-tRNA synthetase
MVPHGDRSNVVIEPWLTEQWYCDAATLAKPALEAVEDGRTQFVPDNWKNTYFEWMRNIQPWCISRQLWWGHQIPAWYDENDNIYVAETLAEAQAKAGAGAVLRRDADVLDTWFSSALWPFSTLGWPEDKPEVARYYPGDVLVTGFDIIFFWVARMMMMGLHFMKDVPFKKIYIHALVRDEKGQKMSKTKGNVIDPLDMIDKYGTDALRFTLSSLSTPGRDIKLATGRIESGRNFATKLWNATRFCQMNGCALDQNFDPMQAKLTINQWIFSETIAAIKQATDALDIYRFDEAAGGLYQFAWTMFCDWYLEFSKPIFIGDDEAAKVETRATTAWALDKILHLLHPIMPFITEEIGQVLHGEAYMMMLSSWPDVQQAKINQTAVNEIRWVIDTISLIRSVRAELNVPAATNIQIIANGASAIEKERLSQYRDFIFRMARIAGLALDQAVPQGAAQTVLGQVTFVLPLADIIDLDAERARLDKETARLSDEIAKLDQKLKNPMFVDKAPEEVVNEHRERLTHAQTTLASLSVARARLKA